MFSSALKSFSSNISANYSISPQPTCVSGPWKIYDGKKKAGGKIVSVFVFERKSLDTGVTKSSGSGLSQAKDEVVERLKKEASSLARLRHPSILELAEPVEETRTGGLTFATEPITISLGGLLEELDAREKNGAGSRSRKHVVEDSASGTRREVELDELEIQKGLLQLGKGLEFLHESAGLVHGNLTPYAIFINAKSDWKLSGLGFSSSPESPLALSEVMNFDPRLPRHVQLDLDYASPDFVMDSNVNVASDMFSLGLIVIALYNSPHKSPLETDSSLVTYRKLLSSPTSTPTQRNNYLSGQSIPAEVVSSLLPRLITRRPAQRAGAREFQQAQYFDSILVSTLRFLDSLPAKTPNEKAQFMRGLPRIMPQFPKAVLEKKVLPALLEEMKDVDLLAPLLENIFRIVELAPNGKRSFSEMVVPRLREIFLTSGKNSKSQERDTSKEGGLAVVLENMNLVTTHCTNKDFKDDILPILFLTLDSPTHSIQDAALNSLTVVLPALDFSTIKNDVYPAVAHVFSKTSSMAIKIRGLEAFSVLCGGSAVFESEAGKDLMPAQTKANSSSAVLDKYTIQEKVVPLMKAIRTKEPAVMMAALQVFRQVGKVADTQFLALEVLPCLWAFSLGPLLNLDQFQEFMALVKTLSTRIEQEQIRKLQQLGGRGGSSWQNPATNRSGGEQDFESLVTGRAPTKVTTANSNGNNDSWESGWDVPPAPTSYQQPTQQAAAASSTWSQSTVPVKQALAPQRTAQASRTITPDQGINSAASMAPSRPVKQSSFSQPLQPQSPHLQPSRPAARTGPNYSSWHAPADANNPWAGSAAPPQSSGMQLTSSSTVSNPWAAIDSAWGAPNISGLNLGGNKNGAGGFGQTGSKNSMDKYDSLL